MINTFFSAKLASYETIAVFIFSEVRKPNSAKIKLIKNDEEITDLQIVKQSFINGLEFYECRPKNKIELGNEYAISIESFGVTPLVMDDATSFKNFDDEYFYSGDDLGFTYSNEKTTWKVWAPLASKVVLFIKKDDEPFQTFKMVRGEKGVYSITLYGDYENFKYRFQVVNSCYTTLVTDPYAKASTANGKDSVVIDFDKTKIDMYDENLKKYQNYVDTIIYELNVRDFTIDDCTNIEHKGKFLGLVEGSKVTKGGHPCGYDYLKSLNITHVQLLPIFDFKTVDELNPDKSYNWGYDPQQYFVPEGSYSTDPNDGYSRVLECKKMISELHKAGLKVNMDVVYNHVYNYDQSVFEKIVPNYYFRKQQNGLLSVASGCGNELDTARPMVRKLIIDSILFWVKEYDIDGLRFDLMGLIDIDTIEKISRLCKNIKSDFMIYGEGWNMPSSLEESKRCTILNAFKVPNVAFFNDTYRDIVRGPSGFGKNDPGYMLGNLNYKEGFKFVLLGSCVDYCFPRKFLSANQSINYVECHDNVTLYDKITSTSKNMDENYVYRIINSINATISLSFGVPFYHAGQEIGLTKQNKDNTYNSGDEFNKFDWAILDKRYDMYLYFRSILAFRNKREKTFDSKLIEKNNYFINYDKGALGFRTNKLFESEPHVDYIFAFNPNNCDVSIKLDDYYIIVCPLVGYIENSFLYSGTHETLLPYQVEVLELKK
jgi:pullulanase